MGQYNAIRMLLARILVLREYLADVASGMRRISCVRVGHSLMPMFVFFLFLFFLLLLLFVFHVLTNSSIFSH
jgi:hypothetical protein